MTEILGIFGLQGWGKSALTAFFALQAKIMGYHIYSNFPFNFDYTPVTTIKEAQSCRNGILCLDEIWKWVHARTSQSKVNKEMMAICLLNRKRGVSIIYNSQLPRTVDVILKDVTNYRYLPRMVTHEDGKRYVHYTVKDIIDRESEEMIVPMPIDELGQYFDTRYEIDDLVKNNELTPLQKGIGLEQDFAKAINKLKGINDVQIIPNSGNGSGWSYDVIVYANNGVYACDVKGSSKDYVYVTEHGKAFLKKINNAYNHKAIPCIVYPKYDRVRKTMPNAWYIYFLNNNSYLRELKTMPYYNKLIKNSKKLIDMNFYKK